MTRRDHPRQTWDAPGEEERRAGERNEAGGSDARATAVTGAARALRARARNPQRCREIMTREPIFCLPGDTVARAAQRMKNAGVGAMPVVDDAEARLLLGIVTDRDLVVRGAAAGGHPGDARVEKAMTSEPLVCHAEDDVQDAADSMVAHQVRHLPVVDDDGRLVGIIARADVAGRMRAPDGGTAGLVEEASRPLY